MKADFYGFLYDLWFSNWPGNTSLVEDSAIKSTFMDGGYYRVDVNEHLSVLALNT